MKPNNIVKRLKNRDMLIGTWIQCGDPTIAEVLQSVTYGCNSYDWVGIDLEHTHLNYGDVVNISRTLLLRDCLVRVQSNDKMQIRRVLDAGANGVIVPMIETKGAAERAVVAAKYPDSSLYGLKGIRGFGFSRSNGWGQHFDLCAVKDNKETCVIAMIETKRGVDNAEKIVGVDGIDGVFIGPYDLSGSYGHPGDIQCKEVKDGCKRIVDLCAQYNKSVGIHIVIPTEDSIGQAIADGFNFIALGTDLVFLYREAHKSLSMTITKIKEINNGREASTDIRST